MPKPKITIANAGPLITKSGFSGYDVCLNTYVGCQFGCKYCYVRFFIKDDSEWGEFVRLRKHIDHKLPKEIARGYTKISTGKITKKDPKTGKDKKCTIYRELPHSEARLVIGTMTDPYQPAERKHRLTRTAIKHLIGKPFVKVGIFTRSPMVLNDLDLIKQLPDARIHVSITPYDRDTIRKIEPIPVRTKRRFEVVQRIKDAGIKVHVNVAPTMPLYSDPHTEAFAKQLGEIGVDEFFVDPIQPYDQSFKATKEVLQDDEIWPEAEAIMQSKKRFEEWKQQYKDSWIAAWQKYGSKNTLPIWSDHVKHAMGSGWVDMRTGKDLNRQRYNDE